MAFDADAELRELRDRIDALRRGLDDLDFGAADCHDDYVGITYSVGSYYPTAVGVYYGVKPAKIAGNETEGTTATVEPTSDPPILALCLGPNAPAEGAQIVYSVEPGGRFAFNY